MLAFDFAASCSARRHSCAAHSDDGRECQCLDIPRHSLISHRIVACRHVKWSRRSRTQVLARKMEPLVRRGFREKHSARSNPASPARFLAKAILPSPHPAVSSSCRTAASRGRKEPEEQFRRAVRIDRHPVLPPCPQGAFAPKNTSTEPVGIFLNAGGDRASTCLVHVLDQRMRLAVVGRHGPSIMEAGASLGTTRR